MEVKTVTISSKRQISIPRSLNTFREGDRILLIGTKDSIILKPMPEHMDPILLTKKLLREAWDSPEDEHAFAYLQDEVQKK